MNLNIPIIDTHVHLWDPDKIIYPWLSDYPQFNKKFDLEDYRQATALINIDSIVFEECSAERSMAVKEAGWIASLTRDNNIIKGIVARAPLEDGDKVKAVVEQLIEIP
ncbi:unnamed protein product, partial [marine sediment metagenome]